ncbi:MAG: SDR family oxidoreductase, partial [Thermoplasmatota archaeon]
MKKLTGARVMAIKQDADALEAGKDLSPLGDEGWTPVKVDRVLKDGDTVAFGGTTLRADVYFPTTLETGKPAEGPFPVLVTQTPYGKDVTIAGERAGRVRERQGDVGQQFRNTYEHTKLEAEQVVHDSGLPAAILRPSVIVGDSRTGYTSTYHHFYRFLELGMRLANRAGKDGEAKRGRRSDIALRLPLTGEEMQSFVPVDWV